MEKTKDFKSKLFSYIKDCRKEPSTWSFYFIPELLIICDSVPFRAIILSHLLYLCDKGKRKDGFFYKSHRELSKETGASKNSIIRTISWLKEQGLLEVKIIKALGQPTSHYKFNHAKLRSFCRAKLLKYDRKY